VENLAAADFTGSEHAALCQSFQFVVGNASFGDSDRKTQIVEEALQTVNALGNDSIGMEERGGINAHDPDGELEEAAGNIVADISHPGGHHDGQCGAVGHVVKGTEFVTHEMAGPIAAATTGTDTTGGIVPGLPETTVRWDREALTLECPVRILPLTVVLGNPDPVPVRQKRFTAAPDGKIRSGWQTEGEESFYVCRDGFVLETGKGTGNYGHLVVHSAGLDVDLYTARSRDEYQEVVDTENSALVVQERRDVEPVIADRRSQGFDLSGVEVDSTAAVIYPDGSIEEFVCVHTTKGINLERDVIDLEGGSLWEQNEGGLCAYASAGSENKEEVIVVFWEPLEKAEEGPEETSE